MALGLARWGNRGITSCSTGTEHTPDLFLYAAQQLNLTPQECFVVEDAATSLSSLGHNNLAISSTLL